MWDECKATIGVNLGENRMEDISLLASLLNRMNQNQLALGAAVEELAVWAEQNGSAAVASNVRGALDTLDRNQEFINQGLLSLPSEGRN
jgi:hypothetical protein